MATFTEFIIFVPNVRSVAQATGSATPKQG